MSDDPIEGDIPYRNGMVIVVKVTKVGRFGVVAEMQAGFQGLLHCSEMVGPLTVGQEVKVRILRVDPEIMKIGLSVKRL